MRHTIIIMLLAVTSMTAFAQTRYDARMTVDSVEREFIVVRPSGATPPGGYPLVFMFHGTTDSGEVFYHNSRWKEKGEEEKFITVFPSSLEYCFLDDNGNPERTTKWSNGEAQTVKCPGGRLKNDVHFVRAMLDTIMQMLPIDRSRIYASGFSNGGGFVSKLAVEMSDVFAAVAAVAGTLHELDSASPNRTIPIAFAVGSHDNKFYKPFGISEVPFNDSCLGYSSRLIRRYLGAFNLAEMYSSRDSTALSLTYLFNTPASTGSLSSQFSFTLLRGMAHIYPNGTNYPVTSANVFWQFFSRFTNSLSVDATTSANEPLAVYPNPTDSYLVVQGEGTITLTLSTMLGEPIFTTTTSTGIHVELPELAPGVYLAELLAGRQRSIQMIILR